MDLTSYLQQALLAVLANEEHAEAVSKDLLTGEGGTSVQEHPLSKETCFAPALSPCRSGSTRS